MRWIEFPESPFQLKLAELPPREEQTRGDRILIMAGGDAVADRLTAIGFTRHRSGAWVHLNRIDGLKAVEETFPEGRVLDLAPEDFGRRFYVRISAPKPVRETRLVEEPAEAVATPPEQAAEEDAPESARPIHRFERGDLFAERDSEAFAERQRRRDAEEAARQEEHQRIKDLIASSRLLGDNRQRQSVYEAPDGQRFVQSGWSSVKMEIGSTNNAPGAFLRASDPQSYAACTDSLVQQMANGRIVRLEDLAAFASIILDREVTQDSPDLITLHAEIEAACGRHIAQHASQTARASYAAAVPLHEGKAYLAALTRAHPNLSSTPIPLAVIAQRVLGAQADVADKRVVVLGPVGLASSLPRSAKVVISTPDEAAAERARQSLLALGRGDEAVAAGPTDWSGSAMAIIATEPSLLPSIVEHEGFPFTRTDLLEAAKSLAARDPMGRTVLILRHRDDDTTGELEQFRAWLGRRFALEGTTDIDGGLLTGRPEAASTRMIVVGRARPEVLAEPPEAAMKIRPVADMASLWTWTSEVVANRVAIEEYHTALEAGLIDASGQAEGAPLELNHFQKPYPALSNVGRASTMVARSLEAATHAALSRLAKNHPNVDEWVANELAMSMRQLGEVFSPEQVDAMALCIDSMREGRGFLNADMTGIGKGRFLAGMMRWAMLNGYSKTLFMTEKAINLSDIVRDLRHIESLDDFSVMVMNGGVKIINEDDGSVVMKSSPTEEVEAATNALQWPEGYNLVLATYSQFNRSGDLEGAGKEPKRRRSETPEAHAERVEAWRAARTEDGTVSMKAAWLRNVVDKGTFVITDESHNAAYVGSNVGENLDHIVDRAGAIVYSSATYAKNTKTMGLYRRLLPEGFDASQLGEVLRRGGTGMQEALSEMLVRDGRLITRQHDLSNCTFEATVDDLRRDRNLEMMDRLAPIVSGMGYLSGELDNAIETANETLARRIRDRMGDNVKSAKAQIKKIQIQRTGFGSPLFLMSRLFMASLLADKAADEAITALRNGQKPVITVENTIQPILEEAMKAASEDGGGPVIPDFRNVLDRMLNQVSKARQKDKHGVTQIIDQGVPTPGEKIEDMMASAVLAALPDNVRNPVAAMASPDADFKTVFQSAIADAADKIVTSPEFQAAGEKADEYLLAATSRMTGIAQSLGEDPVTAAKEISLLHDLLPQTPARQIARLRAMVAALPDLPVSAIDMVREKVEAEGLRLFEAGEIARPWVMGEITGRSLEVRNGVVQRREAADKTQIKNAFNAGEIDGLIINAAGMTGIDLQAGRRFADQRQRVMIVLQQNTDINKQIQAYGRVNRYDQVVGPVIRDLLLGMPIEYLFLARRNAHLRRLSANVNSDREHAALIKDVPEMLNDIGDEVCTRYGEARPDLMKRLGFSVNRNAEIAARNAEASEIRGDGEESGDNDRSANEFLARVGAMLPADVQAEVIADITSEFRAAVEERTAQGTNPLKAREIQGIVHMKDRTVFDGAEGDDAQSVFHKPVYVQRIIIEKTVEPMRGAEVATLAERGMASAGIETGDMWADRLERQKGEYLRQFIGRDDVSVESALEAGRPAVVRMNEKTNKLISTVRQLQPGSEIVVTDEGVPISAIVTQVRRPGDRLSTRGHDFQASMYEVVCVVPGDSQPRFITLSWLLQDESFEVRPGLHGGDYQGLLRRFDTALEGSKLEGRHVLTGNIWQAMNLAIEHKLGQMVQWKDDGGVQHRGVLVARNKENLNFLPIRMRSAAMVSDAVTWEPPPRTGGKAPNPADRIRVHGASSMSPEAVTVTRSKENANLFRIAMPWQSSKAYGSVYDSPEVNALVAQRNVAPNNKAPTLEVDGDHLQAAIQTLMDAGVPFYAKSSHRNWANAWLSVNFGAGTQAEHAPDANETPTPLRAAA